MTRFLSALFVCTVVAIAQSGNTRGEAAKAAGKLAGGDSIKQGHSKHGAAFDSGPRTKPYEMSGIGVAAFPITHKNPEVQKWFNQGNTLLHHFWDYEAERAFRWALKLEPDNAMGYWGLARAAGGERSREFIREAVKRKSTVSPREQLYIEYLEKLELTDTLRDREVSWDDRKREARKPLETLCVKYPDDLEAKALLAYFDMGESRFATEAVIREILARNPDHPGAHHYRIHNWNYHEAEQALESCRKYGELAPSSGHAQHMPGHVYSTVGMWHEAAISMDAATRVEKRNMRERMTFPYNHWNYGHNRAYLCYIQEQLGMASAALEGSRQLMDSPLDPDFNADGFFSSYSQGIRATIRTLVKFERWNDLLKPETVNYRDTFHDKMLKAYAHARARLGEGEVDKAEKLLEELSGLKKDLEKNKNLEEFYDVLSMDLRAQIALARGRTLEGITLLSQAAEKQFEMQRRDNDPPSYPEVLYNALGRAYLQTKSPSLAAKAFEKALTLVRNDLFALSWLVEAYASAGEKAKAEQTMSALLHLSSDADRGLPVIERAMSTGIRAEPHDPSPAPQRSYRSVTLDKFGPALWEPFPAPVFEGKGVDGKPVSLSSLKGKNVILVFYLGRECLHCMNQLKDLQTKNEVWSRLDTVVVAASPNAPEETKQAAASAKLDFIRFAADPARENARRFRAYDDFEEMELHATILIDRQGRVHWARTGGDPFSDMAFLEKQLGLMNRSVEPALAANE